MIELMKLKGVNKSVTVMLRGALALRFLVLRQESC